MKKLTGFALALLVSASSFASTYIRYDDRALNLLTSVHNNCPVEFIQAMKGANRVGEATYIDDRTGVQVYRIKTVAGGFAPFFESYDVAELTITLTPKKEEGPIAYDRPTQYDVRCQLDDLQN